MTLDCGYRCNFMRFWQLRIKLWSTRLTYMDLHTYCTHVYMYLCTYVYLSLPLTLTHMHTHAHTHTSPHAQDVVTRYAHQNGFHVERRFGWDCHGLPVEYEIDKTLGIKVRREGDRLMSKINRQCRQTTMFICAAVRSSYSTQSVICSPGAWVRWENGRGSLQCWVSEDCHEILTRVGGQCCLATGGRILVFLVAGEQILSIRKISLLK